MKKCILDISIAIIPIVVIFITLIHLNVAIVDSDVLVRDFIFFIVLTPLVEELLFRGLIQKAIATKINRKIIFLSIANIITSVIFALAHIFTNSILHALLTFFPSLVFGLLYDRNKNIMPSVITHAVYNLNIFLIYVKL